MPVLEVAFHIFSKNIAFEINSVAPVTVTDVGVFVSDGNYRDFSDEIFPVRDGEADAVNRNRSLRDDVFCNFGRYIDGVAPAVAFGFKRRNCARPVDMALHEMAAKFLARG